MRSMSRHLRPKDVVAQLRMERQRHKGAFILVEGANDIKRFSAFLDKSTCSLVNCYGKDNVLGAVEIEQNSGREDVLGFADADFDRVSGTHAANDDIIFSGSHDFDLDICLTNVIERYFIEAADAQKVAAEGGCAICIEKILTAIKPLSSLRYANQRHRLGYLLKELRHDAFFDGNAVDIELLIAHVSDGQFSSPMHQVNRAGSAGGCLV